MTMTYYYYDLRTSYKLQVPSLQPRFGSTLVVSEHDGASISPSTLSTITAAKKIGNDISVLVMGKGLDAVAEVSKEIKLPMISNDCEGLRLVPYFVPFD